MKGELGRRILNRKEVEASKGHAVRGRQVLLMFEQFFKINEEAGALYSVEDLLKVTLNSDDLSTFIHNWESVIAGMSHVPEDTTLNPTRTHLEGRLHRDTRRRIEGCN